MTPIAIEGMILSYLQSDAPLMSDAAGGLYAYTALSRLGITRDTLPAAFSSGSYLLPIVVIKARAPIPMIDIFDEKDKIVGRSRVVEFWMYQWVGYDKIEIMDNHIHRLLQGHKFSSYWPVEWDLTTGPMIDDGSLKGASMVRSDYYFRSVRLAA